MKDPKITKQIRFNYKNFCENFNEIPEPDGWGSWSLKRNHILTVQSYFSDLYEFRINDKQSTVTVIPLKTKKQKQKEKKQQEKEKKGAIVTIDGVDFDLESKLLYTQTGIKELIIYMLSLNTNYLLTDVYVIRTAILKDLNYYVKMFYSGYKNSKIDGLDWLINNPKLWPHFLIGELIISKRVDSIVRELLEKYTPSKEEYSPDDKLEIERLFEGVHTVTGEKIYYDESYIKKYIDKACETMKVSNEFLAKRVDEPLYYQLLNKYFRNDKSISKQEKSERKFILLKKRSIKIISKYGSSDWIGGEKGKKRYKINDFDNVDKQKEVLIRFYKVVKAKIIYDIKQGKVHIPSEYHEKYSRLNVGNSLVRDMVGVVSEYWDFWENENEDESKERKFEGIEEFVLREGWSEYNNTVFRGLYKRKVSKRNKINKGKNNKDKS